MVESVVLVGLEVMLLLVQESEDLGQLVELRVQEEIVMLED
jgi:hypothetical protein